MAGLRCGFRCAPKQAHEGCGHLEGDEALGWKVASGYSTHPWGLDRQAPSKTSGCQTCIPESSQELHLHTRCVKPSAAAEEGAWAQGGFSVGVAVEWMYCMHPPCHPRVPRGCSHHLEMPWCGATSILHRPCASSCLSGQSYVGPEGLSKSGGDPSEDELHQGLRCLG